MLLSLKLKTFLAILKLCAGLCFVPFNIRVMEAVMETASVPGNTASTLREQARCLQGECLQIPWETFSRQGTNMATSSSRKTEWYASSWFSLRLSMYFILLSSFCSLYLYVSVITRVCSPSFLIRIVLALNLNDLI